MKDLLKRFFSIIWALLRLLNVLLIAILSAIHNIIFNNSEVISMTLTLRPQSPERDKLSYIDRLFANNIELAKGGKIPKADEFDQQDPFTPDEYFDDSDEDFDEGFEGEEGEEDDGDDNAGGPKKA